MCKEKRAELGEVKRKKNRGKQRQDRRGKKKK